MNNPWSRFVVHHKNGSVSFNLDDFLRSPKCRSQLERAMRDRVQVSASGAVSVNLAAFLRSEDGATQLADIRQLRESLRKE